jgi:hypothetical protein
MIEKKRHVARLAGSAFVVLAVMAGVTAPVMRLFVRPGLTFERHVIRPIPRSVRNIRADVYQRATFWGRLRGYEEHVSVVRFDISREDLLQVVGARAFRSCGNARYSDRDRDLWTPASPPQAHVPSISLYRGKHVESPSWFDLEKWKRADMESYFTGRYASSGTVDISFLIYNRQLGSAYLIRWERRGKIPY